MSDNDRNDILSPEQLERDDEHMHALEGNRYVVTADEPSGRRSDLDGRPDRSAHGGGGTAGELAELEGAYAFEVCARFGSDRDDISVETNDVSDAFETLLRWYVDNVAADTPPAEAVAVLLENSDLDSGT